MRDQHGVCVLVVEDIAILALDLADMLMACGYAVAGPACTLQQGMQLAEAGDVDVALLDVDLNGRDSGPVADILAARGIPFLFATALDAHDLPLGHQGRPRIAKPYLPQQIVKAVALTLRAECEVGGVVLPPVPCRPGRQSGAGAAA